MALEASMRLRKGDVAMVTRDREPPISPRGFSSVMRTTSQSGPKLVDLISASGSGLSGRSHTDMEIPRTEDYYLVFRVGVFSRTQTIHVRLIFEKAG